MAKSSKVQKHSSQRLKDSLKDLEEGRFTEHENGEDFLEAIDKAIGLHRVKVVLCIDAKMKVTGEYSGQEYLFERAGSIQDVDTRDVEWLLSKRQGGRRCCGGGEEGLQVFQLA